MSLELPSTKPSKKVERKKLLVIVLLIVSFIGFVDSAYLASKHYSGAPINCSILSGCEEVATSEYATVLGIPLALVGAIYYSVVSVLLLVYLETKKYGILLSVVVGSTGAFLTSLILIYIQIAVIGAICLYCMASAASSTILFIGSLFLIKPRIKGRS